MTYYLECIDQKKGGGVVKICMESDASKKSQPKLTEC